MQPSAKDVLDRIQHGLESGRLAELSAFLAGLHPADIAEVLGRLEPAELCHPLLSKLHFGIDFGAGFVHPGFRRALRGVHQ